MEYVVIDVFLFVFLLFAFFSMQTWLARIIFIFALILLWIIAPHVTFAIAKTRAKSKVINACKKVSAKFDCNLNDKFDYTVETEDTVYKAKLIPTRYRAQNLHIQSDKSYTREYYFSVFGKVKIKLPFAIKTKSKPLPDIDTENSIGGKKVISCYIFVKEPVSLTYTEVNVPRQLFNADIIFGKPIYNIQGFANIISKEYK